jgi:hypothetical protein
MSDLRTRISDVLFYKFGVDHAQSNLMAETLIRECNLYCREPLPEHLMRYMTSGGNDE